ncbi:MAG: hypothetical protein PWR13_814 [Archaeoglobi archaeon]|nr:hypothetical protein [Archaeoglobi archaeon]MDK2781786.1 hypothetical protein [Archaeoglobi archaeon]
MKIFLISNNILNAKRYTPLSEDSDKALKVLTHVGALLSKVFDQEVLEEMTDTTSEEEEDSA